MGFHGWTEGPEESAGNPLMEMAGATNVSLSDLPERICDVISSWVERSPEHTAFVEASGSWSYRDLSSAISEAKSWLLSTQISKYDDV